jgi:hypothetical protein
MRLDSGRLHTDKSMRRKAVEDFDETIRDQYGSKLYDMVCNLLREDIAE